MTSYRECPECGEPLRSTGACTSCSYGRSKRGGKAPADPFHGTCAHEFQGQRCANPGSLSSGTHGDGAWYCAGHYPAFAADRELRTPEQRAANRADCAPIIARIYAKLAAARSKHQHSAIPHILAGALLGIDQDPEAEAERRALAEGL